MAWLTGKVQKYSTVTKTNLTIGSSPYIERDGKFYLKTTGKEVKVTITKVNLINREKI